MTGIHTSNTGVSSSAEGTTNDCRQTQEHLRVQRVQPMTVVKHRSIFEYGGYNQWLGYIRQTQEHLRVQRVQPMTGIHTSNTGVSSSTEGTTNDWDTYVKHRSIFEYRGYNQWLGYIRQTQEHLRVQRVQPMTGIHTSNTGASSNTEGTTNDWDTYVKHRSIFEYRGYNQWLGYIRQTQEHLRVQRVQPMTGIHTSNTGASSSTEGTTNDWDTYVKHRSILECRGYNQWLSSNTWASSSTEGTTNDWDTYVKHRSILECRGYNQWLSSNTGASSSVEGTTNDWDTYVKHRSIFECRGYNQWLGYIRQTQEHLRVQRVQPMTGIHTSNTGASSSVEGTTNDWDTYVKHRSIFECRGYNQWLGYIRQTQEHLRVQRVQPMTGIHTSNTGAS